MADVRPIRALHYDPSRVDAGDVTAPPYDVIDAAGRERLVERSPHNVVELDLPRAEGEGDPYEHAAELLQAWKDDGVLTQDAERTIWALEQDYTDPDGNARTRRGFLGRIRVTEYGPGLVRPHERTQPGPKEDRLRLTRATKHNLSPIFVLHSGDAWSRIAPAIEGEAPFCEITDADGTVHRAWRITDPAIHSAVTSELADAELLIADGHHRYETARIYADEIGGDGPHRYTLMCLVSLDDPGLTVFATHRLVSGLADDPEKQEALATVLRENFVVEEVAIDDLDPAGEEGLGVFGYVDSHFRKGFRLWLKDNVDLEVLMPGRSAAYRDLDAAILEKVVLDGALGMTPEDVEAKRGLGYAKSASEALAALDSGYDAAFLLRPTPIDQVRSVADAGETMPPKSTYFFPKLLTGIVFNPLS